MLRMMMAVLVMTALVACLPPTVGRPISTTTVAAFQVGHTTRAEAEAALGPPSYETMDGQDVTLTWTYGERTEGYQYRSKVLTLRFGPNGRMKNLYDVPGAK